MHKPVRQEVVEVVEKLKGNGSRALKILDLGGGFFPFALATHVVDMISYEKFLDIYAKRSYNALGVWGGSTPSFNKESWIVHNIASAGPLPFPDKYFDFCVCCHLLEDLVNPFKAVEELSRVAKAGYIEVPSKEYECTWGVDGVLGRKYAGFNHHYWLFSKTGDGLLIEPKYSFINSRACFHFSNKHKGVLERSNKHVLTYFWEWTIHLKIADTPLTQDLRMRHKEYIRKIKGNSVSSILLDLYQKMKDIGNKRRYGA